MDPRSVRCTFRPSQHTHSCLVTHDPQAWAVTREPLRDQNGTIGQSKVTRDNVTGFRSENAETRHTFTVEPDEKIPGSSCG